MSHKIPCFDLNNIFAEITTQLVDEERGDMVHGVPPRTDFVDGEKIEDPDTIGYNFIVNYNIRDPFSKLYVNGIDKNIRVWVSFLVWDGPESRQILQIGELCCLEKCDLSDKKKSDYIGQMFFSADRADELPKSC